MVFGLDCSYIQSNLNGSNMALIAPIYSRTSMARTSLAPWKFVEDMGSSSH